MAKVRRNNETVYRENATFKTVITPLFKKIPSLNDAFQILLLSIIKFLIKLGAWPAKLLLLGLQHVINLTKYIRNDSKMIFLLHFPTIAQPHLPHLVIHSPLILKSTPPKKSINNKKTGFISRKVRIILVASILMLVFYTVLIIKLASNLPSPTRLSDNTTPLTTQIYDRNGNLLYQIYEGRNRKLVTLDQIPQNMINATIAIEDKHFYSHPGIDIFGIVRAFFSDLSQDSMQGGSTITQQLIKNTLLTSDRTIERKIKEVILALWAENIYSKKDILQMYFNEVPYGGPAWGIEAASEMYFGKSVKDLDLAESAYLAGLPAAPTYYSPYGTHPEKGKQRQKEVLDLMVEDGYISKDQATEAFAEDISFKKPIAEIKAPHFVMYVRALLASEYGERTVSQGGLKVITTLDLNTQETAQKVVSDQVANLAKLKVSNGAAMVLDAQTGQILAMVGSKDYFDPNGGNYNVSLAIRQPGSSIKVATYATAFKQGYSPGTILLDTPTTFPNPWGQSYTPVNYDSKFHGPVTVRTALGSSYNIPAVKMLAVVGIPEMIKTARDMGITTFDANGNYGLSLTLGGQAVRMIDMMSIYDTLADGGTHYKPTAILKVTDADRNVLEDHTKPEGQKVLGDEITYLISSILSDNQARTPAFGSNSQLVIPGHTVAVKTGTSDDKRDNWAFGYTPKYVVGTWVGNNDYSPMDPKLSSGITGATPIWHDIMANILKDQPDIAFTRPSDIIETTINGRKDLAIAGEPVKSVVFSKLVKQKDEVTGTEKDIITFSDPFINSYIPNTQSKQ